MNQKSWLCRIIIVFSVLTILPTVSFAKRPPPDFCIRNEADFNTYQSQLPAFLKPMPALIGGDGKVALVVSVVAAIKLSFQNGVMVFTSDTWKPGGRYTDKMEIRSACFYKKNKKIAMQFANGVVSESKYNETQLISQGFAMRRVTPAAHQALIAKISNNNGGRPGRATPVGAGN